MRWRPILWLLLSLACFLGAFYFWRLAEQWRHEKASKAAATEAASQPDESVRTRQRMVRPASTAPMALLPLSGSTNALAGRTNATASSRLKYRLANTDKPVRELGRSDQAILLANALIDSSQPINLAIPGTLRAKGDPGAYVVQSRGPIDETFRARLRGAGASIVSYIPNNAYLVRADGTTARQLASMPGTQAVIPFEPYYKLDGKLLQAVVENQPLRDDALLNVVVFSDARGEVETALAQSGAAVVSEDYSPFGPVLKVKPQPNQLVELAGMPGVQNISIATPRMPANDLSRPRVGVAIDSVVETNYLGLTGQNITVNVNDSGVDAEHPDLANVIGDRAVSLTDSNGHGTHVAGIIASTGDKSDTITFASGSSLPAVAKQFRGAAPDAQIFSMSIFGPDAPGDFELQSAPARTNAIISNNSWTYGTSDYDIAAASFDAAVRDALPHVTGSQPLLFVFAAGNSGNGNDDGEGVSDGTILSPATAKNVITVGAIEQLRNITNEIEIIRPGETNTSDPWVGMTDSDSEVASFSSRGNVGVDIEGEFGRFKPDVVAPGTFVVSTTRKDHWDQVSYYNPTNYHIDRFVDRVAPGAVEAYPIFLPYNTVEFAVRAFAIHPPVNLPVYVSRSGFPTEASYDYTGINEVVIPYPNPVETFWFYGIGNPTNTSVRFEVITQYATTNDQGNYFQVLSNMNSELGDFYRYETGTSMAAPAVAGVLALMADYFTNELQLIPSPALMKAMLINGARTVNAKYDLEVRKTLNDQGWGLVNLTNSLPAGLEKEATTGSMLFFDQHPTNALATGERRTFNIRVHSAASNQPVRITLVWTDPPGNPAAGMKLVNNLDLVVTNLDSQEVFIGNDIPVGSSFTFPWDTNSAPEFDIVNNVENVFLLNPVGTNYSVTVIGRSVNVNAVTGQTNKVAQDYALVVSSGDGAVANAITITAQPAYGSASVPNITSLTNQFGSVTNISGQLLLNQRLGANPALMSTDIVPLGTNTIWGEAGTNGAITLGLTNQWRFYILTNNSGFTNAAFATFLPPNLSLPRMGVTNYDHVEESGRIEGDIDLYVSTNPGLLNLDPAVIEAADKSVGRGGTEIIAYTNSAAGDVYYVGVHSEDQQAAEYAFLGVISQEPFSTTDENGVQHVRGINVPAIIPDGTPERPGGVQVIAIALQPITVRRVVVTNTLSHENIADLFGVLTHNQVSAVLNNHSCIEDTSSGSCVTNVLYVYEDNEEMPAHRTDGPGSLRNFMGEQGAGVWLMTQVDNSSGHIGQVDSFWLRIEPQFPEGEGTVLDIAPESFAYLLVDVPVEATNLTITVSYTESVPLELYVRRGDFPTRTEYDHTLPITTGDNVLVIDGASTPSLEPGRYYIGIYNPDTAPHTVTVLVEVGRHIAGISPLEFVSDGPVPIIDDAVTYSSIAITNDQRIAQIWVGAQIDHPRVSDLALTLLSPSGKRILLFENRGGATTNGLGGGIVTTNVFPTGTNNSSVGPAAYTNELAGVPESGTLVIDYNFGDLYSDVLDVYDGNMAHLGGFGPTTNSGQFRLNYGPITTSNLFIVMNGEQTPDPGTFWEYTATIISAELSYFTFTDDTNFAQLPIKFAIPPFTGTNAMTNATLLGTNVGLAYFPEEPLKPLVGDNVRGEWKLEAWDSRAGATNPAPRIVSWRLQFILENIIPSFTVLTPGETVTNSIPPCSIAYFAVDVPSIAFAATNTLVFADGPVNVYFNQNGLPGIGGTNAGDILMLSGSTGGEFTLITNGINGNPPLETGQRYFIGIENPCDATTNVTFGFRVDFGLNIITLTNGVAYFATNDPGVRVTDPYRFVVPSDAARAQFEINSPSGDLILVARKGLPLPSEFLHDYLSDNPGSNDELIVVFTNSAPVELSPGDWFLGAVNNSGAPVSYSIKATTWTTTGRPINVIGTQYTPPDGTNTGSFCITWESLVGVHYFVQGVTNLSDTNWTTISPTITATNTTTTYCVELPSPYSFFRVGEGIVQTAFVPPPQLTITRTASGYRLDWTGPTSAKYRVQWTPSLAPATWTEISPDVTSSTGAFTYEDDGSQTGGLDSERFYRVRVVP